MLTTVEGTFKDGKVELNETPPAGLQSARVLVIFLPQNGTESAAGADAGSRQVTFGMFKGAWRETTEEDFRAAEWRGESEEADADETRR